MTAEAAWEQLTARAATERPALMRSYLAQLPPDEVAHLLALSAFAARREVLDRLAQRARPPSR